MSISEKRYWLIKSEPETFSFDDLEKKKTSVESWDGIRNYQARNYMRDDMRVGDLLLFYHSSCSVPAVMGIAEVVREAYPDYTAWDTKSSYYDPKSSKESPRWFMVDIKYKTRLKRPVTLTEIKATKALSEMLLVKKGQRLSIQPVSKKHFDTIVSLSTK